MPNVINLEELGIKDSGSVVIINRSATWKKESKVKSSFNYDKTVETKPGVYYWYKGFKGLTEAGLDKCVISRLPVNTFIRKRMWELIEKKGYHGTIEYTDGNVRHTVYPITQEEYDKMLSVAKEDYLMKEKEVRINEEEKRDKEENERIKADIAGLGYYSRWCNPSVDITDEIREELIAKGIYNIVIGLRWRAKVIKWNTSDRDTDKKFLK